MLGFDQMAKPSIARSYQERLAVAMEGPDPEATPVAKVVSPYSRDVPAYGERQMMAILDGTTVYGPLTPPQFTLHVVAEEGNEDTKKGVTPPSVGH